jgi:ATP-dependent helicase/nuclease subunit A
MRLREIIETKAVTVWDAGAKAWRPARYGDVAILMRRMSYLHIYEKALEDHEVPYYVVAGRGFFKQQEVLDVIHLLRVLNDPTDDLHLAGVLRSPFFAVSDEGLFRLKQTGRPLHAALAAAAEADRLDPEDRRGLRRAASLLPRWTAAKDRLGLAALVDHVALESGYGASAVGRFGGERAYANLRQMVELARRFERQGLYALGDFIGYVTDFMRSEMRQEQAPVEVPGGNTVRLMTIHKAKGLEFPVVVVPDLAYVPKGGQGQFFVHPATGVALRMRDEEGESRTSSALALARRDAADADRAETWRLFYVALTRAKDYLLFASHVGYTSDAGTWLDALRQGLKYDGRPGEMGLELPSRHIIHVNAGPPGAKAGGKAERRVGSRGLFEAGRVAWGQLHERGQRAKKQGALSALEQVRPVASPRQAPVRITATAIETYRHCPALYWWSEVLGVREPEPPVLSEIGLSAMAWGVLGHRALELATSPDDAVVRAAVESSFRETPVASRTSEGRLRERLTAAIRGFWESPIGKRAAGARRVFREMPFVLALDGTEIRGKMDLLFEGADGRWEVVDYKSSVVAAEAAAERAEEYELQLGVYALAASRWLGQPVSRRSVFFLGSGVGASRDLGLADVGRIEEAARRALAGIAAGQYERETIERCRACRHKRLCETGVKS